MAKNSFQKLSPILKCVHICYNLVGGFAYESYVPIFARCLVIILLIFGQVTLTVCTIETCLRLDIWKNLSVVMVNIVILYFASSASFSVFLTYLRREKLHQLFQLMDEPESSWTTDFDKEMTDLGINIMKKLKLYLYALLIHFFNKCAAIRRAFQTPFQIDYMSDCVFSYPFPAPQNAGGYFAVLSIQTVVLCPSVAIYFVNPALTFVLAEYFEMRCGQLRTMIRDRSNIFLENIEKSYEREKIISTTSNERVVRLLKEKIFRETCCEHFEADMNKWIKCYQQLYKQMDINNRHLEIIFNVNLILSSLGCIGFTFVVLQGINESNYYWIAVVLAALSHVYFYCSIGDRMKGMTEELAEELYATPWYHLSPKHRKTLLTFLHLLQNTPGLLSFKSWNINRTLFPKFLNKVYSYLQVLRVMQTK